MSTRHKDDLCVPECKTGPSMGTNHRRFDLWTMARSYSPLTFYGYEIKISRADYPQDKKWQDYLPYCNQFYWVTPWGMVKPEETPGECGLIWCSQNLTRTYVKKKAAHRKIDAPAKLIGLHSYVPGIH